MEQQLIWTEYHRVSWDDTNLAGKLNLTGLNIMFQRAAVEHAEHLGFGYVEMSKENYSWVLIRINIEIYRWPLWREKVKLITWPRTMKNLSAMREFELYAEQDDELLVTASSEWFLIDLDSRRPQRMEKMQRFESMLTDKKAINKTPSRINRNQDFTDLFSITPRYSSMDMNGHTNARKYIDWLDDAIFKVYGEREISFLHMSYFHECHLDEELIIQSGVKGSGVVRGWKPEQEQVAFLASVEFKKSD
jgi:acyl-CoA thioesterase FadM